MNLYKRTATGNAAALNPKSALPRKLRTLLISIDGRTREPTYIRTLSSFGDVAALLGSLRELGLIEIVPEDGGNPVAPAKNTEWQATDGATVAQMGPSTLSYSELDGAFAAANIRNGSQPSDEVSSWERFQPEPRAPFSDAPYGSGNTLQAQPQRAGAPPTSAQYQLRSAISLMSDFVTTHLPAESLEIVLLLESIGSVEQVIDSLKGYQAMIAPAGPAAARHLEELRNLLARR